MSSSKYDVQRVFDEALQLFERKNADYGDSWRHHGWKGNLGRILEKADRLQRLHWHGSDLTPSVTDETGRQTALDMINTLAFFVVNWDNGKQWGNEPDRPVYDPSPTPPRGYVPLPGEQQNSNGAMLELTAEQTRQAMQPSPTPRREDPSA